MPTRTPTHPTLPPGYVPPDDRDPAWCVEWCAPDRLVDVATAANARGGNGGGGGGGDGKQLATTIHRERRPSSTAFHKEPNVRRLSRTDQLLKTMIVDLSPFDMADDVVEKSTEKPTEKKGTCSDDLFDFA